jgi:hypothetical protein
VLSQSGRGRLKLTDGETCVTGTMDTALADSYGDLQMGQLLKITAACCFGYTIPTQNQGPAFAAATGQAFIFITTYEVLGEAECPPGAEAAPQLSKATLDRTTTTSTPGDHPTCMLATTAVACA